MNVNRITLIIAVHILLASLALSCSRDNAGTSTKKTGTRNNPTEKLTGKLPIDKIKLPPGFKIDVYAENIDNARSLCLSPNGTLYIGNRTSGSVYALRDTNNDFRADLKYELISGLNKPNGVAFKDGDLFFAEVDKVWTFRNIESKLDNPGNPELIFDGYPDKSHHGWKYIAFGPDDLLYIPVGAPCNVCKSDAPVFASITRLDITNPSAGYEIVHAGIRNTVGFDWHPETHELWFTDNGRDWMGDDQPFCELNYAPRDSMHFGFPYCHQGDLPDPEFGKGKPCSGFTPPAINLGPHVAPLGMEFYEGSMFPEEYTNQVLIAEHGSWNRSVPIGYRLTLVRVSENTVADSYEVFAEGWLDEKKGRAWGRPVDLEHLPDGSLLVSDDFANAVYRIYYAGD